jgi:hypothetical protein
VWLVLWLRVPAAEASHDLIVLDARVQHKTSFPQSTMSAKVSKTADERKDRASINRSFPQSLCFVFEPVVTSALVQSSPIDLEHKKEELGSRGCSGKCTSYLLGSPNQAFFHRCQLLCRETLWKCIFTYSSWTYVSHSLSCYHHPSMEAQDSLGLQRKFTQQKEWFSCDTFACNLWNKFTTPAFFPYLLVP